MPLEPTLQEVLAEVIESRLLELHTAIPGKVISYDASKQTAEVLPVVQRVDPTEDGGSTLTRLPSIPNVPVQWPRGGGYAIHFPLAAGDHVLLVFSEAAIGHWRASGEIAPPGDLRRCSLGYPVAIPGIAPEASPLTDAPADEGVVNVPSGKALRVGAAGADFVALAAQTDANFKLIVDLFTNWVPVPNDGGAALKGAATSLQQIAPVGATQLKAT